ncbi:prephenate dehydrogenase [Candidatus Saccharibacteria bacterium]|nr:prephenate dehydrogenase [Candidatus Saccharibacteria bacterium]MCB9821439.1 prephenate dehydrogenase [Candidatus Nomurabacteria bacterium]
MQIVNKIGVIGMGSMGKLIARYASRWGQVEYFDNQVIESDHASPVELRQVCLADIVFLVVPLGAYTKLLPQIAKHLNPEAIFVDVASVKLEPERLIKQHLGRHQHILLSHPLFGPESASASLENHKFIVTLATGRAQQLVDFLDKNLNLDVIRKTALEHDQAMAQVQGLTFFLSRALDVYGLNGQSTGLETPSFSWVKGLAELDKHHSQELLETIQVYNPEAVKARQQLLDILIKLNQDYANQHGSDRLS